MGIIASLALDSILTMVDESRKRVTSIGSLMTEQGVHFREVSSAMENVSGMTRSVADAVKEQEAGVELIGKTSMHINDLTGSVKRALEEQSKVAMQLSGTTSTFDSMANSVDNLSKTQASQMKTINETVHDIRQLFEQEKGLITNVEEDRNKTMASLADLLEEINRFAV